MLQTDASSIASHTLSMSSGLHVRLTIMLSLLSFLDHHHHHCSTEMHSFNLSTSYIPQMVCESYAHYEALSLRAFGPAGPNDQWFALLTINGSSAGIEPLLALDCEVQCILLPSSLPYIRPEEIVPAEVNRRLTRCTFFLQPENFMLLDPTTEWMQSIGVDPRAEEPGSIFGLRTQTQTASSSSSNHRFYIGRNRQTTPNTSEHILNTVVARPGPRLPLFRSNQAFALKSSLPEVLLSSDQPSVIFGLTQVENQTEGTFCIVKIEYEQLGQLDNGEPHREKRKEIRVHVTELPMCVFVNVSISSGYFSEMKGLLLLATDHRQEVLFYYPLNSTPKGHTAQVVNSMPYKDFLVCGTKKSTYAVNIGVIVSVTVFLLIILLVSAETIPRWTSSYRSGALKQAKVDTTCKAADTSKSTVGGLKTTTTKTTATVESSETDGRLNHKA